MTFDQVTGQNCPQNTNFFHIWAYVFWPKLLSIDKLWEIMILMLFWKKKFLEGKWTWPPRWRRRISGLETRPKSWPTGWNFWVNCYLKKNVFENLRQISNFSRDARSKYTKFKIYYRNLFLILSHRNRTTYLQEWLQS